MSDIQALPMLDQEFVVNRLGLSADDLAVLLGIFREELTGFIAFFSEERESLHEDVRQKAHRLKSEAVNVGAMQVHQLAVALELAIQGEEAEAASAYRLELLAALERLYNVLS